MFFYKFSSHYVVLALKNSLEIDQLHKVLMDVLQAPTLQRSLWVLASLDCPIAYNSLELVGL